MNSLEAAVDEVLFFLFFVRNAGKAGQLNYGSKVTAKYLVKGRLLPGHEEP